MLSRFICGFTPFFYPTLLIFFTTSYMLILFLLFFNLIKLFHFKWKWIFLSSIFEYHDISDCWCDLCFLFSRQSCTRDKTKIQKCAEFFLPMKSCAGKYAVFKFLPSPLTNTMPARNSKENGSLCKRQLFVSHWDTNICIPLNFKIKYANTITCKRLKGSWHQG